MKVIFHPRFYEVYTSDPAAARGRMESIVKALEREFEFVESMEASEEDLGRVHGRSHIRNVKEEPEEDWGGLLETDDYHSIGQWTKEFALRKCQGRRFGVLEGGYNHSVLGKNVKSFLKGFSD